MSITITPATGDPIVAIELYDNFSKGISGQGPIVEKQYLVPWNRSDDFANAVMGISSATIINGTISRTSPHPCPESPNLLALDVGPIVGVTPLPPDDGHPSFVEAIVPVRYGVYPYNFGGGNSNADPNNWHTPDGQAYAFCTFRITGGGELLSFPETSYKFATGAAAGKPVGTPIGVRLTNATIVCTVRQIPYLPWQTLLINMTRVNDTTFFGMPAETILYETCTTNYTYTSDGQMTQDIELVFRYRNVGWNRLPSPTNGSSFELVTVDGTTGGTRMYMPADLRPLIFGVSLI